MKAVNQFKRHTWWGGGGVVGTGAGQTLTNKSARKLQRQLVQQMIV